MKVCVLSPPRGAGRLGAYVAGDGDRLSSALARRPPPLLGLAALQVLGQELTADLSRLREGVLSAGRTRGVQATVPLVSHGLSFGALSASPDGALDTSALLGVAPDLIVRPFGARGSHATLREAVREELSRHVTAALSDPQVTALVAWLALGPVPVREIPGEPDLALAAAAGETRFEGLGCASCQVPSLSLASSAFPLRPVGTVALTVDPEPPRLTPDDSGALRVWLYSDLKRHDPGPGLAEAEGGALFLTRPLWGVASAAPYLHDGSAPTLEDAILAHGGEALPARDAYAALGYRERGSLRVFLTTLTRARRLTVP